MTYRKYSPDPDWAGIFWALVIGTGFVALGLAILAFIWMLVP